MCCSFRHRDDELLRGEEGGKTDHLHVDETGVLTRPHHLGLGEIPGALRPQRPQRAVRFQSRDERRKPPQIVSQILYGLGSLGGSEAEAFLYTLESGAADEEVRRAAADAFADLRRKQTEAAAARPVVGR